MKKRISRKGLTKILLFVALLLIVMLIVNLAIERPLFPNPEKNLVRVVIQNSKLPAPSEGINSIKFYSDNEEDALAMQEFIEIISSAKGKLKFEGKNSIMAHAYGDMHISLYKELKVPYTWDRYLSINSEIGSVELAKLGIFYIEVTNPHELNEKLWEFWHKYYVE